MFGSIIFGFLFFVSAFAAEDSTAPLLQWRIPLSEVAKTEDQKLKVEISSPHIPSHIGSLGLTSGELKLFSGHALNLLKSKCPNVNRHTIFKLHKYIGKRIAKTNPVIGNNQKMMGLWGKMMECSSKVVLANAKQEVKNGVVGRSGLSDSDEQMFMLPPGVFVLEDKKQETKTLQATATKDVKKAEVVTVVKKEEKPAEKKKWNEMNMNEKAREVATMFQHIEPQRKSPPAPEAKPTVATTPKPRRNPVIGWLSEVMETVSSFFRGLFGFGNGRSRRDTDHDENTAIILSIWKPAEGSGEVRPIDGRTGFLAFFDEVCRIYCETCQNQMSREFKIAAKELLQFLFTDDSTGLDLAASHYLNHEFLQSVHEC